MEIHSHCFIVNCASNANKAEPFIREHLGYLNSIFKESEFVYIKKEDSIKDAAKKASETFNTIIACGGDGTVNKVANGIIGTNATLGVLPLGSGNDFAKSIGLSRNFRENVKILQKRNVQQVDVIETNAEIFLNTFGVGLDGLTNHYASKLPFKRGYYRYFVGGLMALILSKPFLISYNYKNKQCEELVWMAIVANGKFEGGRYLISPTSVNSDGVFEVILVKDIHKLFLAVQFIKLSMGLSFKESIAKIITTSEFSFSTSENKKIHADGEKVSEKNSFHFKLKERVLPVITKKEKVYPQ